MFRAYIQLTNMHHHRRQQWWAWLRAQVNNNIPFARGFCERNLSDRIASAHKSMDYSATTGRTSLRFTDIKHTLLTRIIMHIRSCESTANLKEVCAKRCHSQMT